MRKLNYLTVDWPLRQELLFPQVGPLIVEIGFGNGDFLAHLAETNPDCNVIGFEISSRSMHKAEAKIDKLALENARPIHGRAETALAHLLEPETVRAFHINNPDPWFKKKHRRRRLIKRETVDLLTSRLVIGGQLHLATDVRDYAEMAHAAFSQTPGLSNRFDAPWVNEIAGRTQTKYELKGYREGRRGHFFCYERNDAPAPHPPVIKELDMPHLFLQSPLNAEEIVERFETMKLASGDARIAIMQAYANPRRNTVVFEVVVEEPTIEQHALLSLSPRAEAGQYIVKLTGVGHARPTVGMHRAVETVGEWVASLDEGARVLERKLRG
ncbi:MAG: tRNA (guanosine(46)-N7)-methyltransferase TrmB [Chloroflexi bacterium]|nr:tRNA (guanosine(46)-N7)-methyltransferase TrmB [Chloroflexota bacterium]